MLIEIKVIAKNPIFLRGTNTGVFELCSKKNVKQEDGSFEEELYAHKWFNSLGNAFDHIMKLRICASDATTLAELKEALQEEFDKLHSMFDGFTSSQDEADEAHATKPERKRSNRRSKLRKAVEVDTDTEKETETPVRSSRRRKPRRS